MSLVIMSFCFNFVVPEQTINPDDVDGNELEIKKKDSAAKSVSIVSSDII